MFALDVYYNQTYGSRLGTGAGSRHDNSNHGYGSSGGGGSGSGSGQGNSYGGSGGGSGGGSFQNLAENALPLLFNPYPKYRDPFLDTYRSIGAAAARRSIKADRILQWISLAHET